MPKECTVSLKSLLGLEPPLMKEVRKVPYYLLPILTFGLSETLHKADTACQFMKATLFSNSLTSRGFTTAT